MTEPLHVRFGPFEATSADARLRRDGEVVVLQELPFRLLMVLLRKPGEVVSRDELRVALWGDTIVEYEAGLNTAVRKLRDALGDDPTAPTYIETVPKHGYRFCVPVHAVTPKAPAETPARSDTLDVVPAATRRPPWRWAVAATSVCVVVALWLFWPTPGMDSPAVPRLLVVPVGGPTATPGRGAALTDQLIAHLARLDPSKLIVLGPMTSRGIADLGDPPAAPPALRVDYLLSARLTEDGDLRLAVTLSRAADQAVVWSDVLVDNTGEDWPALSARWLTAAARGVVGTLGLTSERAVARAATLNGDAFEAYVEGRAAWARFDAHGLSASLVSFQAATKHDSAFVEAHVGVAEAYGLLALLQLAPVQPSLIAAMAAATEALRLEPDHPAALAALAFAQLYAGQDTSAVAQHFERALVLDAGRALTHQWAAAVFSARGQHDRALALAERAHTLDPLSPTVNSDLCWYSYFAGDYAGAAARAEQAFQQFGRPGLLLCAQLAYAQLRDVTSERGALIRRLTSAGRATDVDALRAAFTSGGMTALRAADLTRLERSATGADSYQRAVATLMLGDADRAARLLEALAADRPPWFAFLAVDPAFHALRSDTRHREVLLRLSNAAAPATSVASGSNGHDPSPQTARGTRP